MLRLSSTGGFFFLEFRCGFYRSNIVFAKYDILLLMISDQTGSVKACGDGYKHEKII